MVRLGLKLSTVSGIKLSDASAAARSSKGWLPWRRLAEGGTRGSLDSPVETPEGSSAGSPMGSPKGSPRANSKGLTSTSGSPRTSLRSAGSGSSRSRARPFMLARRKSKPERVKVLKELKDHEYKAINKWQEKLTRRSKKDNDGPKKKDALELLASIPEEATTAEVEAELEADNEAAMWSMRDIIDELGLTIEPVVEDLGAKEILELKRRGKIDVDNDDIITAFKRHKSLQGKRLFEAEQANNVGCEYFNLGDVHQAKAYFEAAMKSIPTDIKPAAQELDDLRAFILDRYAGDEQAFQTGLADGEWRVAFSRKRFISVMRSLLYPGDPDRLFSMADSFDRDGKITMVEITQLLRTRPVKLNELDRDLMEKGVVTNNLACCHVQLGEYTVALGMFRKALKIVTRKAAGGEDDPMVLRVQSNIATTYIQQGNIESALTFLNNILSRREKVDGPYDEEVLNTLYQIGYCFLVKANRIDIIHDVHRTDGRAQDKPVEVNYSLALLTFKERLRRQEVLLERFDPEENPFGEDVQLQLEIARSSELIAEIHEHRGELDRALPYLEHAVDIKGEVLDESDPELVSTWNMLAMLCVRTGHFATAADIMDKAIAGTAALFGDPSSTLAIVLYHMGHILFKLGCELLREDVEEAKTQLITALEKLDKVKEMQEELIDLHAAEHLASTVHMMGSVHLALGSTRDARRCFCAALMSRIKLFGRNHSITAASAHALGVLYGRLPRRREEAILLLQKAVSVRQQRFGSGSLHLAESLHELGSVLLLRKNYGDAQTALEHLSRAAKLRERHLGKENLTYAASLHQVGQAYMHVDNFQEAKLYLQGAVAVREALAGKKSALTASSKYALGVALIHLGETPAALKKLKGAYHVRETLFGRVHPLCADGLHQIGIAHWKQGEVHAAMPFLRKALDIRRELNDAEGEARADDSDEDPADLVKKRTDRDSRIAKKRAIKRKLVAKVQRQLSADARRSRTSNRRQSTSRMTISHTLSASASHALSASRGVASVMMSLRSGGIKQVAKTDSDGDDIEKGGDGDGEGSDNNADAGSDNGSDGSGPKAVRKGAKEKKEKEQGEAGDDDSEIDAKACGVNVQGFLAGPIGDSMHLMAKIYLDLNDLAQARWYLDRAICIREEVYGTNSEEYGESLHLLGVYWKRNDAPMQALKYFRRSLRVREAATGHSSVATAASCAAVAEALMDVDHTDEAGIYTMRAVRIREGIFGKDDPTANELQEKWNFAVANTMQYDPIERGEALPNFAKRSPESYLHGYASRHAGETKPTPQGANVAASPSPAPPVVSGSRSNAPTSASRQSTKVDAAGASSRQSTKISATGP